MEHETTIIVPATDYSEAGRNTAIIVIRAASCTSTMLHNGQTEMRVSFPLKIPMPMGNPKFDMGALGDTVTPQHGYEFEWGTLGMT